MTILLFLLLPSVKSSALTFDNLPTEQTSKQWSVQIGQAKQDKGLAKPKKGEYHSYSLTVDNVGSAVNTVEVNLYRNEPNTATKYSLVGSPSVEKCNEEKFEIATSLAKQMNKGIPYQFHNFLLAEKATELEVEIIWTEGDSGRQLKETFTFTSE